MFGSRPDPVPSESGSKEHGHNGNLGESVDASKDCGARAIQEPTGLSDTTDDLLISGSREKVLIPVRKRYGGC